MVSRKYEELQEKKLKYLLWLGKRATVRDEEIKVIRHWLEEDTIEEARIETLSPGDMVTISNGAFKNKEALIKEVGKKNAAHFTANGICRRSKNQ